MAGGTAESEANSKSKSTQSISVSDLPAAAPLLTTSTNLQSLVHRNKNQHRLTKWWKSLNLYRRHLSRLLSTFSSITSLETQTGLDWDERVQRRSELLEAFRLEAVFMRHVLAPRCYLAFSTVVADGQYAALGLMLLGSLAEVDTALRGVAPSNTKESEHEEEVVVVDTVAVEAEKGDLDVDLGEKIERTPAVTKETVALALEHTRNTAGAVGGSTAKMSSKKRVLPGDGDIAASDENVEGVKKKMIKKSSKKGALLDSPLPATVQKPAAAPEKKKKKKKKKKGGDAFDDLFSGLM